MSTPTSGISKLSLSSKMPNPGEKGKQPAKDPDHDPSDSDSDESDDSNDSLLFAVDHCRQVSDYYAFQLAYAEVMNYSLRIKSDSTITCDNTRCQEPGVCRHVQWLLQQLSRTRSENAVGGPYQHISRLGIRRVCKELNWELKDSSDPPEDIQWELKKDRLASRRGSQTRGMAQGRKKAVQIIMDAMLVGQHKTAIYNEDITTDNMFVPLNIEATLCKMLLVDDQFFYQFSSLISRSERYFFYKLLAEAKGTFLLLDRYIDVGPVPGQPPHDVNWCAKALVSIVNEISEATFKQMSRAVKEDAVRALVYILEEVVKKRNYDIYADITWSRRPVVDEKDTDRNLYKLLVGSSSASDPAQGNFVIAALQSLRDVLERAVDDLEDILDTITNPGFGAPVAYVSKLRDLVKLPKYGSAAAAKRLGEGLQKQGNDKRMK